LAKIKDFISDEFVNKPERLLIDSVHSDEGSDFMLFIEYILLTQQN